MKILIVGGVAGGATVAARLRRIDEKAEIIMFERGEYVSYANCGLPYYIGDTITERNNLFVQTVEGFTKRFAIDIRVWSEVTAVNPKEKTIQVKNTQTGETYTETYDKLVLSTGAEPLRPPFPGVDSPQIFTLRNVPDMDKIKNYLVQNKPKKAVVIGGGFIGLEMVENLQHAGVEVAVVERLNQVMAPLDFSMAAQVHQHLKAKGVGLLLEESVTGFESAGTQLSVKLESGKTIETDLVILSIGVRPDIKLAKEAGLEIGNLGGIKTDEYMQTSHPDIYALGDAVEVYHPITGKPALIPLAGPANKQGRIVADNLIKGNKSKYKGSIGTSIAKVFDLTVAAAGASAKLLQRENIAYQSSFTHGNSHAGYYPGALPMSIKIIFSPEDGRLLGAQAVGYLGVDKRMEMLAQVIRNQGTIYDLQEIEHAYAPPYSSAKDPVNMAGFVAENILTHQVQAVQWREIEKLNPQEAILVDVRTPEEYQMGNITGSINLPLDELRSTLNKIPKDKKIILYCAVGLRGYVGARILLQHGFTQVYNLSGGYKTYSTASARQSTPEAFLRISDMKENQTQNQTQKNSPMQAISALAEVKVINIDACGMQCPGPIMQLKKNYDQIDTGDQLEIKVTDQAFAEDLNGWSNMMGAKVLNIDNSGGIITARIEKTPQQQNTETAVAPKQKSQTMIVFSDDLDKALATFVIANGAAASGKKVSLFFTFWGLNVIKKNTKPEVQKDIFGKMFGMMMPSNSKNLSLSKMNMGGLGSKMMRYVMKDKKVDSLENLMQQALDNGVEMIACSMSMDVMGIKKEELNDQVIIGGVAAYLDRADQANVNLFI